MNLCYEYKQYALLESNVGNDIKPIVIDLKRVGQTIGF
jgi:hypothetical protein